MPRQVRLQGILALRDEASSKVERFGKGLDSISAKAKKMGAALTAFGAAGTFAFLKLSQAAQAQNIGISKLDAALQNIGLSYASLKGEIEAVAESQQRLTNFGDEQTRETLQKLIALSGDYEDSLRAVNTVMDTAIALDINLASATTLIGRGLSGNTELFSRYGIEIEKGATVTELLTKLTSQFGGAAAAAVDPLTQMKNRLGDVAELLGDQVLPFVNQAANAIEKMSRKILELNPTLVKVAVLTLAAASAFALIAGPVLLMVGFLPQIAKGFALATKGIKSFSVALTGLRAVMVTFLIPLLAVIAAYEVLVRALRVVNEALNAVLPAFLEMDEKALKTLPTATEFFASVLGDLNNVLDGTVIALDNVRKSSEQLQDEWMVLFTKAGLVGGALWDTAKASEAFGQGAVLWMDTAGQSSRMFFNIWGEGWDRSRQGISNFSAEFELFRDRFNKTFGTTSIITEMPDIWAEAWDKIVQTVKHSTSSIITEMPDIWAEAWEDTVQTVKHSVTSILNALSQLSFGEATSGRIGGPGSGLHIAAGLTGAFSEGGAINAAVAAANAAMIAAGQALLPQGGGGGRINAPLGTPVPIIAHGQEVIVPAGQTLSMGDINVTIQGNATAADADHIARRVAEEVDFILGQRLVAEEQVRGS